MTNNDHSQPRKPRPAAPASKAMREISVGAMQTRGVTIEARYTVGEDDIVILSAKQSGGLALWLAENGYRVPAGAARVLGSYIRQGMKFFVAKVNLKEQAKTGVAYLRPLQFAFESEKFMLPVRLGMLNAKGPQDLVVYVLTPKGRVETTNYRTVKLPANETGDKLVTHGGLTFGGIITDNRMKIGQMLDIFTELKTYAHGLAFNASKHLRVCLDRPAARFVSDIQLAQNFVGSALTNVWMDSAALGFDLAVLARRARHYGLPFRIMSEESNTTAARAPGVSACRRRRRRRRRCGFGRTGRCRRRCRNSSRGWRSTRRRSRRRRGHPTPRARRESRPPPRAASAASSARDRTP